MLKTEKSQYSPGKTIIKLLLFIFIISISANLQAGDKIKIRLHQPPPNMLGVKDLWKLDITNLTRDDIKIFLTGNLSEAKDGLIVDGKSKVFTVKPGKSTYGYDDFKSGEVNWKNKSYQEVILRTGNVKEGNYTICVTALFENGDVADQESCIEQTIMQSGSITLISPSDGEEVNPEQPVMFTWTPLPKGGPYSLRIVELKGSQSPDEAFRLNRPILEKEGIKGTNYQYGLADPKLEVGKKYAWKITSGEVTSEVYKLLIGSAGQSINVQFIPRDCENCCFDMKVIGNFSPMFNAFRFSNAFTNISSVTPTSGNTVSNQTSTSVIIHSTSFFTPNSIVGTICFDYVPNSFLAAVQWSTNGGASFMNPEDSLTLHCAPPCGSSKCDSLSATATSYQGQGNCCWQISLSHPQNTTGIKRIQFKPLPTGTNTFASASLTNMTGWSPNVSNPNEYKVTYTSGTVPPGQLNGFFTCCLNALSSPQYVVVNWLSITDSVICSDTVTVNCDIPCVTFTKDSVVCNGNGYNLTYSFINNSNFSISNISYTVIPSSVNIIPAITILSTPVTSTNNSGNITVGLTGATQNSNVCVVMKFQSPDSCCWCYDTLCVTIPPACICDSVGATLTGDPNSCCYNLSLSNNFQANYFTQVNLTCITAGVTISTFSFNSNWGSSSVFPPTLAQVVHNSNFIPLGTSTNIGTLCFTGAVNPPEYLLVEWIRNDSVKCVDTLEITCSHAIEENDCAQIVNDTIICLPDGTFQYTFQVQNNDNTHDATGFQLNPLTNGLILTNSDFSLAPILHNGTSAPQTLIISGIGQNTPFCFEVAEYQHVGNSYSWCCHGDTVCLTTPVCNSTDCKCKGWKGKIIGVSVNGNPALKYDCGSKITADLNSTIIVGFPSYICTPDSCKAKYTWNLTGGNSNVNISGTGNSVSYTYTSPGSYVISMTAYCGGKPCDSCKFYVTIKDGPTGECKCNDSASFSVSYSNGEKGKVKCGETITAAYQSTLIFSPTALCIPKKCLTGYTYNIYDIQTNLPVFGQSMVGSNPFTVTLNSLAGYRIEITYNCGGNKCKCTIYIRTKGDVGCDCKGWKGKQVLVTPIGGTPKTLECGGIFNTTAPNNVTFNFPTYLCNPSNCNATYQWQVSGSSGNASGSGNSFSYNFTTAGLHLATVYSYCGTHKCDSCTITVKVDSSSCLCTKASLEGVNVATRINSGGVWPTVHRIVGPGVELPSCGTTLGMNSNRWNIDFGSNTIKIDFIEGAATYGGGVFFNFSDLIPQGPGCTAGIISGITVTTNHSLVPFNVITAASFTSNSVKIQFAPNAGTIDWYPGDYILVKLNYDCP